MTPCLGIGPGGCPPCSQPCCAVLGVRWGEGPGRLAEQQDPRAWWSARSLLSCELAIQLLLVTSLTKLVFGFWDS